MNLKALLFMLLFAAPVFAQAHPDYDTSKDNGHVELPSIPVPPLKGFAHLVAESSHTAMWFSLGADLGTTWYGVTKDNKEEANPLVGRGGSMLRVSSMAIGLTAVSDWSQHRMIAQGRNKAATTIRLVITGVHIFAVWHNLR